MAESGQKLSFDRKEDKKRIKQLTSDSIICFSSQEGIAVVNIYSGKIIFRSKSKIKKPLIKKPRVVKGDKIYIATSDSTFSAISIIDGKTVWQKSAVKIFNAPVKQLCARSLTDRDLVTRAETSHALIKKHKKINRIAAVYFLRMLCPKLFSSLV